MKCRERTGITVRTEKRDFCCGGGFPTQAGAKTSIQGGWLSIASHALAASPVVENGFWIHWPVAVQSGSDQQHNLPSDVLPFIRSSSLLAMYDPTDEQNNMTYPLTGSMKNLCKNSPLSCANAQ